METCVSTNENACTGVMLVPAALAVSGHPGTLCAAPAVLVSARLMVPVLGGMLLGAGEGRGLESCPLLTVAGRTQTPLVLFLSHLLTPGVQPCVGSDWGAGGWA